MNLALPGEGGEPAIAACDDALAPYHARVLLDPLRDELGVLYEVGRGIQHARQQDLVVWHAPIGPDFPFMGVSRVGSLERDGLHIGREGRAAPLLISDPVR